MDCLNSESIQAHLTIAPLLTAEEVAEQLSVTTHQVWELTRQGQLRVVILGERQYRYTQAAIEEFIQRGGVVPNRPQAGLHVFRLKGPES